MPRDATFVRPVPDRDGAIAPSVRACRWAISLIEPLMPLTRRLVLDDELREVCQHDPAWVATWFGGVLADLMGTLPPDDPWRGLSARVVGRGEEMTRGRPPADAGTGAWRADGSAFGTYDDMSDLVTQTFSDLETDRAVAALLDGLPVNAAAAIAFASDGWQEAGRALAMIHTGSQQVALGIAGRPAADTGQRRWSAASSGRVLFDTGDAAIRWAIARRRAWRLYDHDEWPIESAFNWAWRADRVAAGEQVLQATVDSGIRAEAVETGESGPETS